MESAFESTLSLAGRIRTKQIASREALDGCLERIERRNAALNAVVTLDVERARERAILADDALARGEVWGPLHGVPVTIKDAFSVQGVRTTGGYTAYAEHVPDQDAVAVSRLKAAGAVVFGKTNVPVGSADTQTYNPIFGTTNNPWDLARTPGGSSGGAAAALAAGFTYLELGSDIGGSIRNPAHYCGVYGHKPSHGIVPMLGHIPGPPGTHSQPDLATAGPLARSADDLETAMEILAGPLPDRAVAWTLGLPAARRTSLREYRFAAWLDDDSCPVDSSVATVLESVVDALRRAGAEVDEKARPAVTLDEGLRVYERLIAPIMIGDMVGDASPDPADDSSTARMMRAATAAHRDWLRANERRERYRARWAEFFRDFDVLLCPVTPVPAFAHDHSPFGGRTIVVNGRTRPYGDLLTWCGAIANMALLPATVAPAGRTADGLPVGLQIVGPYLEDRTTIDVARRLTGVTAGFERPPEFDEGG